MPSRKVNVAHRSGYDKSYRNSLTAKCGTLVPLLFDEVIPDTKVNLKINVAASLPPLVSDTYMNVRLRVEAFAIPHRLCYANFQDFFDDYDALITSTTDDGNYFLRTSYNGKGCVPLIRVASSDADNHTNDLPTGGSSLSDYLGLNTYAMVVGDGAVDVNALPFIAYHLVWQEWYRNPRVQKPAFAIDDCADGSVKLFKRGSSGYPLIASALPFTHCFFGDVTQPTIVAYGTEGDSADDALVPYLLADGTNVMSLRQRNFDLDYFTGSMVEPQQGPLAEVAIEDGKFTIASLRAQNSIQQFRERNNLTSPRYNNQMYARYGTSPADGVIQRPLLIGAATYDVYSHGVVQTSPANVEGANPFGNFLGSRGGNAFAAGSDFIIHGFHAKEPMYILVLCSLVPSVTYSQGISPIFMRYRGLGSITDMANHVLQNVGPQPIRNYELYFDDALYLDEFSYTDRYADWMIMKNQVHGQFGYRGTLQPFVLQRVFDETPEFGSEFLEIPTDYLDDVMQVTTDNMGFSYWLDSMLEYKVSQPLRAYSIPSLQDPAYEHGKSINLRNNGQLL